MELEEFQPLDATPCLALTPHAEFCGIINLPPLQNSLSLHVFIESRDYSVTRFLGPLAPVLST
jgi:hypothetical protein